MTVPPRGRLIAVEGIDGSGKSTQACRLAASLGAELTAEPGATELGRRLRALLLDPGGPPRTALAEALLMVADRAQHVHEVIEPALADGRWVVTDRYAGSTLAYQGFGRGIELAGLRQVVAFGTAATEPDLTVLIDLEPEAARQRRPAGEGDRFERLTPDFHRRVRQGYLALAAAQGDGWAVVDGSAGEDTVAADIWAVVTARLGSTVGDRW